MPAFGIEQVGERQYKVCRFRYRHKMVAWVAKKPNRRRPAVTSALDHHLKDKVRKRMGAHNEYCVTLYDTGGLRK